MARGQLDPNAFRSNKVEMTVAGIPLAVTQIGDLSTTLQVLELPDGQRVTAGQTRGGSVEFMVRLADSDAVFLCDEWFLEASDEGGVAPTYRRPVSITQGRIHGETQSYLLHSAWISQRQVPGGQKTPDGSAQDQVMTYTLQYDDIVRLP